jgi:hypothetical protein
MPERSKSKLRAVGLVWQQGHIYLYGGDRRVCLDPAIRVSGRAIGVAVTVAKIAGGVYALFKLFELVSGWVGR